MNLFVTQKSDHFAISGGNPIPPAGAGGGGREIGDVQGGPLPQGVQARAREREAHRPLAIPQQCELSCRRDDFVIPTAGEFLV